MDDCEFQEFGGDWTAIKLEILKKYLTAYTRALKSKPKPDNPFKLLYIDAFAGAGKYLPKRQKQHEPLMFSQLEHRSFEAKSGSARTALEIDLPFHEYYFIEKNPKNVAKLRELKEEYPELSDRINVIEGDSAIELGAIIEKTSWKMERAVLFLDPFALNVSWKTIADVAKTSSIDMWLLFSIHAINRMLTKSGKIDPKWELKLDDVFGEKTWRQEFYEPSKQTTIFNFGADVSCEFVKNADFNKINGYINKRLNSVFAGVAKKPAVLRNSTNTPLFSLFFAVSNENGKDVALKIANSILRNS